MNILSNSFQLCQIPICFLHSIIFYPTTLFLDCQRATFLLLVLLTYTRSLSTQFPPHMPLYYLSIQPISSDPAFSVVPSHLVFPQSALPRFPPTLWPPDRLGSDVPSAPQSSINTDIVPVYALSETVFRNIPYLPYVGSPSFTARSGR